MKKTFQLSPANKRTTNINSRDTQDSQTSFVRVLGMLSDFLRKKIQLKKKLSICDFLVCWPFEMYEPIVLTNV